ncbi:hypothetical protein FB451DRAFT_1454776 [Mycena latifolia]|nr:hypothetical protein FB451DRAFT_1454776 [Mycena latifolia]
MPTRRPPTMEERLLEVEQRLRETEKKLQAALAAKPAKAKRKIPRPKGQSGKGSGYNLRRAMGLQSNKPRYNWQMRIVRYITDRFLDTSKTISKQDKTHLERTIKYIQKEFPFFQRYQGGWPIYDLIKQYLANNHQRYKRAVEKERAAESEDTDDWTVPASEEDAVDDAEAEAEADASDLDSDQMSVDEAEEEDVPNVESAEKDNKNDVSGLDFNADLPELSDNDMDLNQATIEDDDLFEDLLPAKSRKEKENMPPSGSDGSSKKAGPKEKATAATGSISSQKRKEPDSRSDISPRPAKKVLTNTSPRGRVLMQAKNEGWPRRIDFDDVASRVSMLLPDVEDLQTDSTYLEKSIVWTTFLELIGYKVFAFSRSAAPFGSAYLGCGYFGPKGHDIIERTIDTLLADKEFDYMLYETLAPLIDMPCNWDKYDDSSNLISVAKFKKFIVIPHVAATLISKDLKIGMDDALQVLKESREYGELINIIDIEESVDSVETVAARKTAAPKMETDKPSEPPRHRKVSLQLPKQRIISLDDFLPPETKPKKKSLIKNEGVRPKKEDVSYGKPNKKQIPMDAKEKKPLPKKPPTDEPPPLHTYETRGKSKSRRTLTLPGALHQDSSPVWLQAKDDASYLPSRRFEGLQEVRGASNSSSAADYAWYAFSLLYAAKQSLRFGAFRLKLLPSFLPGMSSRPIETPMADSLPPDMLIRACLRLVGLILCAYIQTGELTLSSPAYSSVFRRFAPAMNADAEAVESAVKLAQESAYTRKGVQEGKAVVLSVEGNFMDG